MSVWRVLARSIGGFVFLGVVVFPVLNLFLVARGTDHFVDSQITLWSRSMDGDIFGAGGDYRFDSRWLWEPEPGAVVFGDAINEQVCRGPVIPAPRNDARRVLVIGDSQSFGHGVRDAESWPRRLEAILAQQGFAVEVLNASCPGHTIVLGLARFLGDLWKYKPDVVVIAFGVANEAARPESGLSDVELCGAMRDRRPDLERIALRISLVRRLAVMRGESIQSVEPVQTARLRRVAPHEVAAMTIALIDAIRLDPRATPIVVAPYRADVLLRTDTGLDVFDNAVAHSASVRRAAFVDLAKESVTGEAAAVVAENFRDPIHLTPIGHDRAAQAIARVILESGALTRDKR